MSKTEKEELIIDLIDSVKYAMLEKLSCVPENWDGFELRQWTSDKFAESVFPMSRARKRKYDNDRVVCNI